MAINSGLLAAMQGAQPEDADDANEDQAMEAHETPATEQQEASGDFAGQALSNQKIKQYAANVERALDHIPDAVIKTLTDGQGDLEMEMAEAASNLVSAQLGGAKLDENSLVQLCAIAIASLMRFVLKAKLIDASEMKQTAQRATVMAQHMVQFGKGSVK
jgi:hypothetical protein